MKIAFFNTKSYDRRYFSELNEQYSHDIDYFEYHLNCKTAALVDGHKAVCVFINDRLDRATLCELQSRGVELVALRSAGFNHVDLNAASELGLTVVRVPAYSPAAVAEHSVSLLMTLNRRLHKAYNRVKEGNFSIEGLTGFDVSGKTVGVLGTGKIGLHFAKIMFAFGCKVQAYDPVPSPDGLAMGLEYVDLDVLLRSSNILSLHCPLTPDTFHILNEEAFAKMPDNITVINTSRGKLIDTKALIGALKRGKIRALGLDVYEEEEDLFFEDLSDKIIQDDTFARLLTFPNVLVTSHQGFLTEEALHNIAETTLDNIRCFEQGLKLGNQIKGYL